MAAPERKAFITSQIQEGKDRESVRRALISNGYSSSGFEAEYSEVIKTLGVPEPKPVEALPTYLETKRSRSVEKRGKRKRVVGISIGPYLSVFLLVSLGGAIWFYFNQEVLKEYGISFEVGQGETVTDTLIKSKVRATSVSARLYGGKMGTYEGVCEDITVVDPVVCRGNTEAYAVYALLSNGEFFCTDSSGVEEMKGQVGGPECTPQR